MMKQLPSWLGAVIPNCARLAGIPTFLELVFLIAASRKSASYQYTGRSGGIRLRR
jgi:hypothetical protein